MKRLTVTYDGKVLVDQDVAEMSWSDTETEVKVIGRTAPRKSFLGDLFAQGMAPEKPSTPRAIGKATDS